MMYYPDHISCDYETYESSKLSVDLFEPLPHKQMKGVGNITVYKYTEENMKSIGSSIVIKPISPIVGRNDELQAIEKVLTSLNNKKVRFYDFIQFIIQFFSGRSLNSNYSN